MAKNTNRVASAIAYVAALGLATGVWAQTTPPEVSNWQLDVKESVTFAQEIFGGDNPDNLDLTLDGDDSGAATPVPGRQGTRVELQLNLLDGVTVGANSEVEVTVSLTGAVFGQAVQWTDIDTGNIAATPDRSVLTKVSGSQKGGRAGENSVTFKLANSNAIEDDNDDPDDNEVETNAVAIVYLGSLEKASGLKTGGKVTASASVLVTAGPTDNFPVKVGSRPVACTESTDTARTAGLKCGDWKAGLAAFDANTAHVADTVVAGSSAVVADSEKGMTFTGNDGAGGEISIADRTKLHKATMIEVASLTYKSSAARDAANENAFSASVGANANITVTVSGQVRDADSIFFDLNANNTMDAKEELSITSGIGTKTVRLSNTNSGAKVYYSPGGTVAMKQGKINTSFAVEYDSPTATSPGDEKASAMLDYAGVTNQARAYAIPNAGMDDIGNVRIKCDASSSAKCTVFLQCNGQDGMDYFGELSSTIAGGATTVLQAEGIGEAINADTWAGRLSCDVLSDADVSVQVLVRSDGSLINNTYVD